MVLCGHDSLTNDPGSMNYRKDQGVNGNTVHQLMVNAQDIDADRDGVGLLLMMRFTNGGNTVSLNYFSPVNNNLAYKEQNQFTIEIDKRFVEEPSVEPTSTPTDLPYGDLNGDDSINAKDALQVLKISVGKVDADEQARKIADVNQDDAVNAKDALEILKYSVNKPSALDKFYKNKE